MAKHEIRHADLDRNADKAGCIGYMRRLYERHKATWRKTDMVQCDQCGTVYVLNWMDFPHSAEKIRDGDKDKMGWDK